MNVRQRMLSISILNRMEEMYKNGNKKVVKDEEGYKYYGENGKVILEAKMKMRSK